MVDLVVVGTVDLSVPVYVSQAEVGVTHFVVVESQQFPHRRELVQEDLTVICRWKPCMVVIMLANWASLASI